MKVTSDFILTLSVAIVGLPNDDCVDVYKHMNRVSK